MQPSILNFFSPKKGQSEHTHGTNVNSEDIDEKIENEDLEYEKRCDDIERIFCVLNDDSLPSNTDHTENHVSNGPNEIEQQTENTHANTQGDSLHAGTNELKSTLVEDKNSIESEKCLESPVHKAPWRNRIPKVYQRQNNVPRPESPEIVIPVLSSPKSPSTRERRFSFSIVSPSHHKRTPSKKYTSPSAKSLKFSNSPKRSQSPNTLFDEVRNIKANNSWEKKEVIDKELKVISHPKKRFKTSSDSTDSEVSSKSTYSLSPLRKLVAKKLVIPCLQPASAFENPPKEIEFYNLRESINNSRQKNYVLMTKPGTVNLSKKFKPNCPVSGYYEIESIVTHKLVKTTQGETQFLFLVKWNGFSDKYNSWEQENHFELSPFILLNYIQRSIINKGTKSEELKAIQSRLKKLQTRIQSKNNKEYVWQLDVELSAQAFRQQYKKLLRQYALKVKDELGASFPTVEIHNDIDYNLPPLNFTFVRDRFAGKGVRISDDTLIGCVCSGEFGVRDCCIKPGVMCCPQMGGADPPYNTRAKLQLKQGSPIYECNARCSCGPDCGNRIVQRGTQVATAIYKTADKGWGLKTLQNIPKGTFVVEYVGEVVTFQEAEQRGKEYDAQGLTYLFDLDYQTNADGDGADEEMFTIDAAFYGNTSHFINHSCDPNLAVFSAWISNLDIRLPHICLFAIKNISAGEELTFNYQIDRIVEEGNRAAQRLSVECRCGAKTCVRYLHG